MNLTTGNYMQTSTHCFVCHQDYFENHQCTLFTNTSCQKCQFRIEAEQALEMLNDKKYCPYCGHKL